MNRLVLVGIIVAVAVVIAGAYVGYQMALEKSRPANVEITEARARIDVAASTLNVTVALASDKAVTVKRIIVEYSYLERKQSGNVVDLTTPRLESSTLNIVVDGEKKLSYVFTLDKASNQMPNIDPNKPVKIIVEYLDVDGLKRVSKTISTTLI